MDVYPRLLRRAPLLPGESLPSLLARLSLLNGYEGLGNINWLAGEDWYSRRKEVASGVASREGRVMDAPSRPERPATYERLAALTGLAPIALYSASAHALNLPRLESRGIFTCPLMVGSIHCPCCPQPCRARSAIRVVRGTARYAYRVSLTINLCGSRRRA